MTYVPVLGVVTQGETIAAALPAAREAARLDSWGRIRHDEEVSIDPLDRVLTTIEVEVPVAAAVS
ncbi:MAG: hypothetical protein M3464_09565 [Chloroflexota bacterium]|nr:hypothetical protein [Chloroflexota bacterium]